MVLEARVFREAMVDGGTPASESMGSSFLLILRLCLDRNACTGIFSSLENFPRHAQKPPQMSVLLLFLSDGTTVRLTTSNIPYSIVQCQDEEDSIWSDDEEIKRFVTTQ